MRVGIVVAGLAVLTACSTPAPRDIDATSSSEVTPTMSATPSMTVGAGSGPPIAIDELEGKIAFSDETNDIWTMRADGSHVRQVTNGRAQEFDPTWSPDGERIAYRHQTGDDTTTEIFVMDAEGMTRTNLTRNGVADWGPDWAPDGRTITFNSAMGTEGFGLLGYRIAPDGTGLDRLGTRHFVEYPDRSPDGSRIVFMAQEPGASGSNPDYNIFVMDADGKDVTRLTDVPGEDGWPAWSPDGSRIVFSSARDDCSISEASDCRSSGDLGPWLDVWIMDADGANQRRVTFEFGQFFTWSPDGSAILVAGAQSLYLIRPDGTGMTPLEVPGVAHPLFPDWIG